MDAQYREILSVRKELIVDKVKWNSQFVAALEKQGVMTEHMLEEIEEETEKDSRRVELLVRRLPKQGKQAFYDFLTVLDDLGYSELATVLRTDTKAARKGSASISQVSTMARYIDLIDQQLQKLISPKTQESERPTIVKEVRARLANVNCFVRQATQHKAQFRRAILRVVEPKFGAPPAWRAPDINLLNSNAIKKWEEHDSHVDQEIYDYVEAYVNTLELNIKKLEGEMDTSNQTKVVRGSWQTDKYGRKVYVEMEETPPCEENFIHVSKQDMLQIIKVLKTHRKMGLPASKGGKGSTSGLLQKAGENMKEQVMNISEQVARLKDRLQQTSDRITELEHEKGTVLAALEEEDLYKPLQDVVMNHIGELQDENCNLESEIKSLRKKIASPDTKKSATNSKQVTTLRYTTVASTPRSRRISAPDADDAKYLAQTQSIDESDERTVVKRSTNSKRMPSWTSATAASTARSRRISAPDIRLKNGHQNVNMTTTQLSLSPRASPRRKSLAKTRNN